MPGRASGPLDLLFSVFMIKVFPPAQIQVGKCSRKRGQRVSQRSGALLCRSCAPALSVSSTDLVLLASKETEEYLQLQKLCPDEAGTEDHPRQETSAADDCGHVSWQRAQVKVAPCLDSSMFPLQPCQRVSGTHSVCVPSSERGAKQSAPCASNAPV